jgi:mannose-6-phosphate isomerase-like protein (cupin superfamily)
MTSKLVDGPRGFIRTFADRDVHELTPGRPLIVAATGKETQDSFGVVEEVVSPGDGPPLHVHHAADELAYILAGEFTWKIGDLQRSGGVGTVAFVPRGTEHTWRNTGLEPGKMLFVFAPAGFEQFLVELSALPKETLTMELANELGKACQTKYVGPPLAALTE